MANLDPQELGARTFQALLDQGLSATDAYRAAQAAVDAAFGFTTQVLGVSASGGASSNQAAPGSGPKLPPLPVMKESAMAAAQAATQVPWRQPPPQQSGTWNWNWNSGWRNWEQQDWKDWRWQGNWSPTWWEAPPPPMPTMDTQQQADYQEFLAMKYGLGSQQAAAPIAPGAPPTTQGSAAPQTPPYTRPLASPKGIPGRSPATGGTGAIHGTVGIQLQGSQVKTASPGQNQAFMPKEKAPPPPLDAPMAPRTKAPPPPLDTPRDKRDGSQPAARTGNAAKRANTTQGTRRNPPGTRISASGRDLDAITGVLNQDKDFQTQVLKVLDRKGFYTIEEYIKDTNKEIKQAIDMAWMQYEVDRDDLAYIGDTWCLCVLRQMLHLNLGIFRENREYWEHWTGSQGIIGRTTCPPHGTLCD